MKVSAILLSGGVGTRMQAEKPKQYLELGKKIVARHSFDCLLPLVAEIVVVCDPAYRDLFSEAHQFALPGIRRQDSVFNGLQMVSADVELILIHDAARPFITDEVVKRVLAAAEKHGAAACGMPIKFTVKETGKDNFVTRTPARHTVYEIQTPQVIKKSLLKKGFEVAYAQNATVTDDVSLVELIGHPVQIVEGSHTNFKITTPEDLIFARCLNTN